MQFWIMNLGLKQGIEVFTMQNDMSLDGSSMSSSGAYWRTIDAAVEIVVSGHGADWRRGGHDDGNHRPISFA